MSFTNNTFDIIIFNGRPAAGKSEVIDFIDKTEENKRIEMFGIGKHTTLDDFVYLWEKGIEDDILEELGEKRLYTIKDHTGYSANNMILYKFLIKKINIEFEKKYLNDNNFFKNNTLFIEFSRGTGKGAGASNDSGGYTAAFNLLHPEILKRAVILYTKVSYKESLRKNLRRYNPDAKESILQHSVPEKIMEMYETDDWDNFVSSNPEYVEVNNIKVPYYTFLNEPELTNNFEKLAPEVKKCFNSLKKIRKNLP